MPNTPQVNQALTTASASVGRAAAAMERWSNAYEGHVDPENNETHAAEQEFEAEMQAIENLVRATPEFFDQTHFRTMAVSLRGLFHALGSSKSVSQIAILTTKQRASWLGMTHLSPADINALIHNS